MMISVTGSTGFVGRSLCDCLASAQHSVDTISRVNESNGSEIIATYGLDNQINWSSIPPGTRCIIHCAARVHVTNDQMMNPMVYFRRANVEATLRLAKHAIDANVRRFIYLSSLKVYGERSPPGSPFQVDSLPNPQDPYSQSKWEAETGLRELARKTGLEVVIIRPPLVYGPGVKANFLSLLRAIARGTPLPLGAIHNLRSLVALDNLCDLIRVCVEHPAAAGQTFLVSDGKDVSTPDLARAIGTALGRPARLLPVPVSWLHLAGRLSGRVTQIERITGSLQVDIGHTMQSLGWEPRVSLQQQLQSLAQHYRS